jgi:D-alanine-D-alanine ligase
LKTRVLVLFGGKSSEHEISLRSASAIIRHLCTEKYQVIQVGITRSGSWLLTEATEVEIAGGTWETFPGNRAVVPVYKANGHGSTGAMLADTAGKMPAVEFDIAFPVLHGKNGEDGTVQGLFEMYAIPYVGCGVSASAVCMDKAFAKMVFEHAGIPQTPWLFVSKCDLFAFSQQIEKTVNEQLSYPVFVKPANSGSSVGVVKVSAPVQLNSALHSACKFDDRIVIEEGVAGQEVEVAVLGNKDPLVSCVGEIVAESDFYDFESKYVKNTSKLLIPAALDKKTATKVRDLARQAYKAANCTGLSRVDFFVRADDGQVLLNEINTMPGFTPISMYPKLFEASGVSFSILLDRLIELGFQKYKEAIDFGHTPHRGI